jgi:HSP20 family protein
MLALRRWNPFREEGMWPFEDLTNLHHEMDRVFGHFWGETPGLRKMMDNGRGFAPPAEVTSDENAWHVRMALPGLEPKDVHVEVTDNVLTVTGERAMEEEKEGKKKQTEFSYGHFERSFTLPKTLNLEGVTAEFENGMLTLMLPMMEAAKPRMIEVKKGGKFFKKTAA